MCALGAVVLAIFAGNVGGVPAENIGIEAFRQAFTPEARPDWSSPRTKRYVALFDEGVETSIARFDFDRGLLDMEGPLPPPEVAQLDRHARKAYAGMSEYAWLYRLGRVSASEDTHFTANGSRLIDVRRVAQRVK